MRSYADLSKKAVIKKGTEVIVIKNTIMPSSINGMTINPYSLVLEKDGNGWIAEKIYLYEDYEDNYYYLFEAIEKADSKQYRAFTSFVRDMLANCEDYAMGKKEDFRI